jgi:gliding motility-associated-like protein
MNFVGRQRPVSSIVYSGKFISLFTCGILLFGNSYSQCTAPISSFPYQEDFEAGNGGWTAGGTGSDWAWGAPSKPVINSAGSGTKCWITGGLAASFYTLGQKSWIQSPCFNLSSLNYPYLTFKVFWETEKQYDGAGLQYSTNGGTSWTNVGSLADAQNCLNQNWFNTSTVTNLTGLATNREGWSGTTQPTSGSCQGGSGSGGWVEARHCLTGLGGSTSVIFRFIFGAGTSCNDYDGFAFDLFVISEAPGIVPDMSFTCQGNNTVAFTGTTNICASTWSWDFGDPASGSSNSSSLQNPTHTFSSDTTFGYTLLASTPCGNSAISFNQMIFPHVSFTSTPVSCPGDSDATLTALVTNYGGPSFLWNIPPPNTSPTLTGLAPGTYSVTVTGPGVCTSEGSYTLTSPAAIQSNMQLVSAGCGPSSGSVRVLVSGGTPPYEYLWTPSGQTTAVAAGLDPEWYSVLVTDSNGCTSAGVMEVPQDCVNDVLFPSAFTPNGDGRNDYFFAAFVRINTYNIRIFNRWGHVVYESDDINAAWDGTYKGSFIENGIYPFIASYSVDGIDFKEKKGTVTVYH